MAQSKTSKSAKTVIKPAAKPAKKLTKSSKKSTATSAARVAAQDKKTAKQVPAKPIAKSSKKAVKRPTKTPAESPAKALVKRSAASASATKKNAKPEKTSRKASPSKLEVHKKRVKETEYGASAEDFKKVTREIAQQQMDLLCDRYPEADCELDFDSPFQLITAVIMSAQTTDVNVNKVTKDLFRKFPTPKALADGNLEEIKEIIRSTGFFNAKATNIQNCAIKLVEKFGGEVPQKIEELVTLPGVGRKTANVVLGVCFGVPGWSVDTHVQRLSKRLGFTNEQDPEKIEYELQEIFPKQDWSKLSITLIWHGRRTCFARKPNCEECPINHLCPSSLMPA